MQTDTIDGNEMEQGTAADVEVSFDPRHGKHCGLHMVRRLTQGRLVLPK